RMTSLARVFALVSMICSGLAVASGVAFADVPLDHRHQTGFSIMPGVGYGVIVPYQEHKNCGDSSGEAGKRVCTGRIPFFVELQFWFGISTRIDLITDFRLGLEGERVTDSHQFAVAPGLRVWIDQDTNVKFYTTVQGVIDSTDQKNQAGISDTDIGFRN